MAEIDYAELTRYAKSFTGLTPDKEALLQKASSTIKPALPGVTDRFYTTLKAIDKTAPFIEGRLDHLKTTHLKWLEELFDGPYDEPYTQAMYQVGPLLKAINAVIGFSLLVMQQSYQLSSLSAELDRFLGITGMSMTLFENLASAYKN
ncbi:MAG: protoglobin domain-containing protein [Candidatus Thiodiazotropha sp.]